MRVPGHHLFLLLFGVAALTGCNRQPAAAAGAGPQAFPVKIQTIQAQRVADSTEYLASLKSRNAAVLQPQVDGQITRILVKSGDRVQQGQVLLEIDPRKQEASVNTQEATQRSRRAGLNWAKQELERRKQLFAAGVISKAELDQAQTAYDAAVADTEALQASVQEQREQLHYYSVKAPAAGVIGDIPVREGDRVTTQTIITTLDTGEDLEAYVNVPAEKASDVRMGTIIEVLDEEDKVALRVPVSFISPRVDPQSQTLLIKARIPRSGTMFRNDQVVHTRVVWREEVRPVIPVTAVSRLSGQAFAYVAAEENGKSFARQRSVRLGDIVNNNYVVLDGLKPGERVIVSNVAMLVDGMPIQPGS